MPANRLMLKIISGREEKEVLHNKEQKDLHGSISLDEIILTSLEIHIAVLNKSGTIIAVNEAWRRFGRDNGAASNACIDAGVNYLEICRQAAKQGSESAGKALDGIKSVLEGSTDFFELKYPCHSQTEERWFLMSVMPLMSDTGGAIVTHKNITDLQKTENALRHALSEIEQLNNRLEAESTLLREEVNLGHRHKEIVGHSDAIKNVLSQAEQVADTDSTVLIMGETGTGKELVARAIHNLSSRNKRPLIKVNCGALPPTLIESELFGREKGAYTGALTRQIGRFEVADDSTIFLDEIGELPLELQPKLLRVLEEGRFERLGSSRTVSTNVRVIAATNRDLLKEVGKGRFRKDLYYRLNVFPINVPPLRDRCEDLPHLVWAFVAEFEKSMNKSIEKIPLKNMDALQTYPWPGNVRELRNVVENAMIISKAKILTIRPPAASPADKKAYLKLEDVERDHITNLLKKTGWRVYGDNGAAQLLGLKPSTLQHRMKKLGIKRPDPVFKNR